VRGVGFEDRGEQAFCSVVRREGRRLGSSTLTRAMFASVPSGVVGKLNLASRLEWGRRNTGPTQTLRTQTEL
jgi:hypothetical protein